MPLILNGTTGVSGIDGSAGTPSYQGTDTNTGIFYPAADTIAFAEGGAEIARFDSSGNLGIGTASPTSVSGYTSLCVNNATNGGFLDLQKGGTTYFRAEIDGSNNALIGSGTATALRLQTNNTERMRITSAGLVGIGTNNPQATLDISRSAGGQNLQLIKPNAGTGGANIYMQSDSGSSGTPVQFNWGSEAYTSGVTGGGPANAYPLTFYTNASERMRINSTGLVGIGTSNPQRLLDVHGAAAAGGGEIGIRLIDTNNSNFGIQLIRTGTGFSYNGIGAVEGVVYSSNILTLASDNNTIMKFATGGSERMRIDTSGNLCIKTTTAGGVGTTIYGQFGNQGLIVINSSATVADVMYFQYNGSIVGKIATTTTATSFVTSSDYRLKENIAPMTGALAKVAQLKPCTYTWKADGSAGQGFIAHELAEVVPDAVSGEKDAVDEDGNIKPQGIDTSFLVATLTAAIQEQQTMIEELKQEVAKLKGV